MMYSNQKNIAMIFYVSTMLALSSMAQQQISNEVVPEKNDAENAREQSGLGYVWPMVKVDQANNKSRTDVHVPIFFDMTSENGKDQSKLDLSVMHGLVSVNHDKVRDLNGTVSGPLTVSIFGIPVYSGRARKATTVAETKAKVRKEEDVLRRPFDDISEKSTPLMQELYINSRKTNERILRSFSELLSKAAKNIEHSIETLSTGSNRPIDNDIAQLVKSSKLNKEDLQPRDSPVKSNNLSSNFLPVNLENKAQPRVS